jgi:hypothetical protein
VRALTKGISTSPKSSGLLTGWSATLSVLLAGRLLYGLRHLGERPFRHAPGHYGEERRRVSGAHGCSELFRRHARQDDRPANHCHRCGCNRSFYAGAGEALSLYLTAQRDTSSSRRADCPSLMFFGLHKLASELALVLFDGKTHELHGFKQVMSHGFLRRGGVTFLDGLINRQMVLQNSRRDAR